MDDATCEHLRSLEEGMWRPETRFDRGWMDRHVTDDVVEFGQSGRVYDKTAMLEPTFREIHAVLPLPDFTVREVVPGVALVTYRSIWDVGDEVLHTNRTSLWIETADGWRMRFHQGTPRTDLPSG
jgi:ribonuclease HI